MHMGQVYRRAWNHPSMHGVWKTWRHGRRRAGAPSSSFSRQMTLTKSASCCLLICSLFSVDDRREEGRWL